jgi:RNA polymerase sigma-70 factor (ECF subfamily)
MYCNDHEHQIALKKAHELYNRDLVHFALRLTGNLDDANQIVADAFNKAYDEKMDLSEESNIRGFLYGTVKFRGIDLLRERKRRKKSIQEFFYAQRNQVDTSDYDLIEAETEMAKKISRMKDAIRKLPEKQRNVIIAIFEEGRSVKEYAESEGVAYSTVINNKNKGLQQLRKMLGDSSIHLLLILCYLSRDHFRN